MSFSLNATNGNKRMSSAEIKEWIYSLIEELRIKAETGEQWSDICELEAIAESL